MAVVDSIDADQDLQSLQFALSSVTAEGVLRVPPRVGEHLFRAITGRSRILSGLARQAIRLAVALDVAGAKDWVVTLHSETDLLRTSRFTTFFKNHPAPGIKWIGQHTLELSGPGLNAREGEAFCLDLKRAPMLGAYLDLVTQMLGFTTVIDLVDEAQQNANPEAAAKQLHDQILEWLHTRLQREHLVKQAACIRAFLTEEGVRTHLDIEDETILSFWEAQLKDNDTVDGFKMWTNAVTQVMAYRRAMSEAADARGIDAALSLDFEDDASGGSLFETISEQSREIDTLDWVSPLAELLSGNSDGPELVKWIASQDALDLLGTFLTHRAYSKEDETVLGMNAFADGRPDTRFIRTWLRYVSFGARQRSLVQHARTPSKTVQEAESYSDVGGKLRKQLEGIAHTFDAASWALLSVEPKVGFMNFLFIDRTKSMEALTQALDGQQIDSLSPDERYVILNKACEIIRSGKSATTQRCRSAFQKVNRKGFKDGDLKNSSVVSELARGAPVLPRLLDDIRMFEQGLRHQQKEEEFIADRKRFERVLGS